MRFDGTVTIAMALDLPGLGTCLQSDCRYDIFVRFERCWRSSVGRASDL
jgi:hypothetical protein